MTGLLQGYEIPRDFILELTPFSRTNHLLTDAGKPVRGQLKSKWASACLDSQPHLHTMFSLEHGAAALIDCQRTGTNGRNQLSRSTPGPAYAGMDLP